MNIYEVQNKRRLALLNVIACQLLPAAKTETLESVAGLLLFPDSKITRNHNGETVLTQ
jgi:hypothetical protein